MKFLVKYVLEINDDEFVELVNSFLYDGEEKYKSCSEISDEDIFTVLYESGYIEEDINYDLDLDRLHISILKDGDKDGMV